MSHIIIGANQGIGLALTQALAARSDPSTTIFATARRPDEATELQELTKSSKAEVIVLRVDMTDEKSVQAAAAAVKNKNNDVASLWINAGLLVGVAPVAEITVEQITANFANLTGPHCVLQAFAPLLVASPAAKVIVISTGAASIGAVPQVAKILSTVPLSLGYCVTKAALNMLTRHWATYHLEPKGVTIVAMHPGLVRTRLAAQAGAGDHPMAITPEESARGMIEVVDTLDKTSDTSKGIFTNELGFVYPW